MKTINFYSLLLKKLFNQRITKFIQVKNHSDFKKFYFLILLIVFFISPRLYADTAFDTSNSTHLSISLGSGVDAYNYIDFKVMVLETAGTDDGMRYCDFYIVEDDNTETKILHMDNANLVHDGLPLDAFTPTNSATNGFIASGLPTYTTSGTITQANFKWYYPQRLISKSIKIKMKYIWDLDLDGKGDTEKYKDITISLPTPPLSNLGLSVKPISDKKFRLSWSNSTNISKLIITYNGIVDSTIVAANSTMVDFTALNVKIDAAFTFKVIPVYIPQNPPGDTYTKRYQGESVDVSSLGIQFVNTIYPSYNVGGQFVDLSWTVGNSSGNTSSYYAKRGSTVLTPNVPFNSREIKDYGDGGTLKNWSSYTYTIYTVPSGGTIADSLTGFKKTVTVYTSPNKPRFEDFKLESYPTIGSIKPYVKASWSADWVGINTVKLYHRVSTDKNFTLLGIIPSHYGTISYEDKNNIIDNSTQIYKLEVNVFDSIFSKIDSVEVVNKVKLKKFKASKNTVSDRIQLSWEIDNLDLCDKFEIYRSFTTDSLGKDVQSTPEIINQLSAQSIYNTWDDHTAAPGILYFYKIIAYKTGLDGKTRTTISTDLGYRMPTGTITGRITYGGGTAVKGVSLYINSSSVDNNILNKSLHFTNNENQLAQIGLTKAQHGCINTGFSFQSWIKMTNTPNNYTPIIEVNKEYSIGLREGYIQIFIGENLDLTKPTTKCKLDSSIINDSSYFHLSVTLDRKTDSLKVYINGIPKKDAFVKINNNTICSFVDEVLSSSTGEIISSRTKSYLGRSTDDQWLEGKDFNGNIDDVRLWSNSIDANSIASNYNHYLNGNEDGLIGYWPMDEGNNSYAFDYSKSNGRFNEHHIILNSIYTSKIIPKTEQLAIKGVTDGDGNYIIHGIPYSGDGSTYSIKPVFGTHTFNPTQQSCYISPTSLVHDGQNFEDKSSFPVKVKVKYSNTKYPVPGVMLYVDENPCSVENKLITTASQLTYDNTRTGEFKTIDAGECVIDVPIGEHYIRAELSNHTFENSGRWPAIGKQEFSENSVNTIEFADTTLVTVVGRVVGGTIENSYPIGFKNSDKKKNHSSHANIGKAQLIMQPTFYKDYSLNYSSADKIQTLTATEASKFGSVAKYKANSSIVEITTDATTGEYMIKLPPIKWDINSVKTSTSSLYSNDMSIISDIQSFNTSKLITATDTATNVETNKVDSFTYNVKKSFVYQAPTVIEVRDAVTQSIAFGESEWHVTSPGLAEEVRSLYTIAGTTPSSVKYLYGVNPTYYPNGKPVFAQGKEYALNIYAYESYKHPEGLDTTTMKQFAKVPLKGATLNIKNEIGVTFKKLVPDASDTIVSNVMKLDSIGKRNYIFKAGFPNLADVNSGLGLTISIQNGSSAPVYWREMGDFRAIVTGCEPIAGTNFVTKGPVLPLVILRDPPGSNSYAYMETGTTLSYSFVNKSVFNGNFSATSTIKIGPKLTTAIGFGFMALTEMENQNSLKIGSEGEYSDFSGSTGTKTIKTTERIQTSASPDFVGSNADVYIGTSTNVYYCQSRDLNIQRTGLAVDTVSTASISGDTEFRFSQNEITTAQIPKWKQMLKQMLITVPEANFNAAKSNYQTQANTNKVNYYLTTLSQSDENFGMDTKTYTIIRPSNLNLTDTIETIANTIRGWQNIIYNNEEQKKTASTNSNYVKENISFDAGTSIVRSYTYTDNKGTTSGGTDKTQAVLGTTFGFAINSIGMQVDAQTKLGGGSESSTNSSKENTTTCGYVLSDPDADNRFAVNVYKNKLLDKSESDLPNTDAYADKSLSSYIFELVGGQSSCPYESADSTLFYKENNKTVKLANGTTPLDAPYINITSYTKTDIPNGKDASFILELGNNSIIQSPRAYMLSVDDTSNPNGAIVSVDGTPLTGGRIFYVTPGQILNKTLTLHQTKLDVLDYQGINLRFSSVCDTITKTQKINVSYVPSCSDLDIALDRQIINTENSNPLAVTLKSFNQEYKNFLGLQLEYKLDGDTKWSSKVFAKDITAKATLANMNIATDMLIPNIGSNYISSFIYNLSFDGLDDGNYSVRAKTLCNNGTQTPINNITSELSVVKDLIRPMAMGVPSPANGILTPETEVAVTFNENIQTSKLIPDNFEVKGVLNGATLQHAEGLALDGTDKSQAFTESSLSLQNSSFSVEGWVRIPTDCLNFGNLFTIGSGADKVALNMKKDGLQFLVNDVILNSKSVPVKTDWQYISVSYNSNNQTITVNLIQSDASLALLSQKLVSPVNPVGRLLVGAGFKGNIHQVTVWSENRTIADLVDMNTLKIGNENNLIGYWPMDEANGNIAVDKARSRNMIVNSSWFIEPNGKASTYNGINQSTLIKTSGIGITKNDNFSIEFWLKGKSQTNATLFSCGKGDSDGNAMEKLSVGINSTGDFCLNTNGNSLIIPSISILDTLWHHFALSVTRNGNSNVYIDGQQKLQISSTKVGGLSTDTMSLGSRYYTDSVIVSGKYFYKKIQDRYFEGSMDEVRIWKCALTADNIRLDMKSRLTNSEIGLIAYYPFEETAVGNVVNYSLKDFSITNVGIAKSNATSTSITPGIKIPRAKEDVSYSYTASDNKIIFLIDAPLAKTENCTLEFAVNKVYDLNGNKLGSPIKWTAYVNNNRLNWETEQISITKEVLDAYTFKAVIVNNSGKYENFIIDGLPGWLSVNVSSGKLNPLEKKELTFTVDPSTNIGSYECRVILTGNNNMQDLLPVSLKITGTRPDWSVNPYDYESSMNVIGQIKIEGVYQEDPEDILGAFIGTRCVGLASPVFDNTKNSYVLYMDIYGNSTDNGQALSFSLWDAGTGRIYPAVDVIGDSIKFVGTTIKGSITNPRVFNATDKVEQQISLKQGWSWMSTNVVNTQTLLIDQFKKGIETAGIQLKSTAGFIGYYNGFWIGNDLTMNQVGMYMVKTSQAKTLKMIGSMAKPVDYPITIKPNWNWIGYVPQFVTPLKTALSGLSAKEGDQIKGQVGFASYSARTGTWYGSLQYMMPGLGYMYNSNNNDSTLFNYPSQYISQSKVEMLDVEVETTKWSVNVNKYQMSMTVTAIAAIDNKEVSNGTMQVGVFIGDECRGTATLKYLDAYQRYMAFLQIWGNTEDMNSKITFRSYDPTNNQEMTAVQSLSFVSDNITGSPIAPYQINFVISGTTDLDMNLLKIYPNPVIDMIHFNSDPSMIEQFEIIDNIGRVLVSDCKINNNSLNVGNLTPGVYTLRIKCNGKTSNQMFVKK